MSLGLAHITFDCAEPARLAGFWSTAVPDRPSWFFIRVPESKAGKNRVHVDLTATDREAEVARLVALGATADSDHDEWGAVWTTMRDPEGNEFCVGQARR